MENKIDSYNDQKGQEMEYPKDGLERRLIEEYLLTKGYTSAELEPLPPEQVRHLLAEASQYASLKLTEIESSAHLWDEVEGKA